MNYIEAMKPIVKKVGDTVLDHFRGQLSIERKLDSSIRTDVDLMSEKMLKKELCALIPGSGFIAEETPKAKIKEYTWVIDPIDGTKNFARGLPYFCINVALMHESKVIAAMTYMPAMSDMIYAQLGYGCWRNGHPVAALGKRWQDVGVLVVVSDFRVGHGEIMGKIKQNFKAQDLNVRFRIGGAAAVDLAYAATGSYDVVLFEKLKWWDVAAGVLLVTEAGGWISQYDGSAITPKFKTLIAGDLEICQLILPYL